MPSQSEVELFKILSNKDIDLDSFKQTQKQFHVNYKNNSIPASNHEPIQGTPPPSPTNIHVNQPAHQSASFDDPLPKQSSDSYDEDENTKQALLYELETLKNLHPELFSDSRTFNRHDSTKSLIYEIERVRSILDVNSNLSILETGVSLGTFGIEEAITRLGLFDCRGWSNFVISRMNKLKPILLKIYRRIFKRGLASINCFLELFIALCTSMFVFVRKKKSSNSAENLSHDDDDDDDDDDDEMDEPNFGSNKSNLVTSTIMPMLFGQ